MTTQLTPVTLDITITNVTAKEVHYTLTANGQAQKWVIPQGSTFNTSVLVPGTRYRVSSRVLTVKVRSKRLRKTVTKQRYDWTVAMPLPNAVKVQARSAKQRQASAALAAMPMVDDGLLFNWR
jgi:hypothetical protein